MALLILIEVLFVGLISFKHRMYYIKNNEGRCRSVLNAKKYYQLIIHINHEDIFVAHSDTTID